MQFVVPSSARAGLSYVGKMDTHGSYALHGPDGVTVDDNGNVFVADTGANRIVEFNALGHGVRSFGKGDNLHIGQNGRLYGPQQVAWSAVNGDIYVTDTGADEVQEFTATGGFVRKWGSQGAGNGQFSDPVGITVDCAGNVYVTNAQNPWDVEEFTSTGSFVKRFGSGHDGVPTGVAVMSYSSTSCTQPDVVVSDEYDGVLTMYNSSGTYLRNIGTQGPGPLQFGSPEQLSARTDGSGTHVWVAESYNNRVQEITTHNQGTTWAKSALINKAGGETYGEPRGVWVDQKGRVLVVQTETAVVYAYKNAAPALTFRQVHNTRHHIHSTKALDFTVAYNQLNQSCRITVSAKVTVPPGKAHVFKVKKAVSAADSTVALSVPLSSRQVKWLHQAWAKGHKVKVASKAAGCSNNNVKVHKSVKFSV